MDSIMNQWFLNVRTGEPELGPQSSINDRIGPYPTREAALKAYKTAKRRNEDWSDDDRKWKAAWDEWPEEERKPDGTIDEAYATAKRRHDEWEAQDRAWKAAWDGPAETDGDAGKDGGPATPDGKSGDKSGDRK